MTQHYFIKSLQEVRQVCTVGAPTLQVEQWCWMRSLRGCDHGVTLELDPGEQRLLTLPPSLECTPSQGSHHGNHFQGCSPEREHDVDTIKPQYVTEPHQGFCINF